MTLQEYFNQGEWYFSESQQERVPIDAMVPPYAVNCLKKLIREYRAEFLGTRLFLALLRYVTPKRVRIEAELMLHGKVTIYVGEYALISEAGARSRLRRAGATRTHREGDVVEGFRAIPDTVVRVKGETVA